MTAPSRFPLFGLVLAAMLPVLLAAAGLLSMSLITERAAQLRQLQDSARALSTAVDPEQAMGMAVARVLAQATPLDQETSVSEDELHGFRRLAAAALLGKQASVEIRSGGGVSIESNPRTVSPATAEIVQPVELDGRVDRNVLLHLLPAELQRRAAALALPGGVASAALDERNMVVARQPAGSDFIGAELLANLTLAMAQGRQGLVHSVAPDGSEATGYFITSRHGWTSLAAMPSDQFSGLASRSMLRLAAACALLLALSLAGAVWAARWASRCMTSPAGAFQRPTIQPQAHTVRAENDTRPPTRQPVQLMLQNQRAHALGRLTGGVAHDINNMLGVISNSLHLIERHDATEQLQIPMAATRRALEAGSRLTRHLQRLSGQQAQAPQSLDLGQALPEMATLLGSLLGRRVNVSVQVAANTSRVQLDTGEFELALLNLGLNARDALPNGGSLQIHAANAHVDDCIGLADAPAGSYVSITVTDDGVGISPELAAQVFEPFFSTRSTGQKAGLGLCQVQDFCQRAGGLARLDSTPGLGTTVTLLLPSTQRV